MKKLVISCDSDILELNIKFAGSTKDGEEATISITEEGVENSNLPQEDDVKPTSPDIDKLYNRISVVDSVSKSEDNDSDFTVPDLSDREDAIDDEFASGDF